MWKLEFWKLEIKFERNWSFENYLKCEVLKIKFEKLEFWKLFEKNRVLKISILKAKVKL